MSSEEHRKEERRIILRRALQDARRLLGDSTPGAKTDLEGVLRAHQTALEAIAQLVEE